MVFYKIRDRIKGFGIANDESFFTCSESITTFFQFFHEPKITNMFQNTITKFFILTKLQRKKQAKLAAILIYRTRLANNNICHKNKTTLLFVICDFVCL